MGKIQVSSPEDEYEARLAYYQRETKKDALSSNEDNELTEEFPF